MATTHHITAVFFCIFMVIMPLMFSCSGSERAADPNRCRIAPLGGAADIAAKSSSVATDRLVSLDGITDPRAMVWRGVKSTKTHYITRVMGTQQKIYYLGSLKSEESPKILSEISGHLVRWSELPQPHRPEAIASALKKKYGLEVDEETLVVVEESKPSGCR